MINIFSRLFLQILTIITPVYREANGFKRSCSARLGILI